MTKSNFGYGTFSLKGTIRGTESFVRIGDCPIYELMERRNWVRIGRLQSVGLYFTTLLVNGLLKMDSKVMQHWNLWICKLACCRQQQKMARGGQVSNTLWNSCKYLNWKQIKQSRLAFYFGLFCSYRPAIGGNDCSKKAVRSPWLSQI